MFHKITDMFFECANHYMETCAKNNIYNVYVDMVRDQMQENRQ